MKELPPIRYIAVLDLETGAKTPDAHIFSIGLTLVDVEDLILADAFYYVCDDSQPGRVTDSETLTWWLKQASKSPQAFKSIFNVEDKLPLDKVLRNLMDWFALHGDPKTIHLMGNGSEFDNVILEHALKQAGLKMPVPYWNNQSLRTIKLVHRLLNGDMASNSLEALPFEGTKHHAGDDADHEAEQLLVALKAIRGYQLYNEEITELKQQLQQQKLAYQQKLKELECNPVNVDMHWVGIGVAAVRALGEVYPNWHNVKGQNDNDKVYNSILSLAPNSKPGRPISLPDGPVNSVYDINKLKNGQALDADIDAVNQDS